MTAWADAAPRAPVAAGGLRTDPIYRFLLLCTAFASPWLGVNLASISISAVDFLIPVALVLVLTGQLARSRLAALYMLFVGLTLATSLVVTVAFGHGPPIPTVLAILRLGAIFSPFVMVFALSDLDEAFARKLLAYAIAGMFLAVLAGDLLYLAGQRVAETQQDLWVREGARWRTALRAGGLHGNSGSFGAQAATLLILYFVARPKLHARSNDINALIVIGVVALAIAGASSRGGLVQAGAALLPMLLLGHLRVSPLIVLAGGMAGLLALIAVANGQLAISLGDMAVAIERLNVLRFFGEGGFLESSRMYFFAVAAQLISDNWFYGIGYKLTIPRFSIVVDNSFLSTLLESGLFTFLAFAAFWLSLLGRAAWLWRIDRLYAPALFFLAFSMFARMMVSAIHSAWNSAPVMFLIIGVFLRLSERRAAALRAARGGNGVPAA